MRTGEEASDFWSYTKVYHTLAIMIGFLSFQLWQYIPVSNRVKDSITKMFAKNDP